jgi:hypothetical protein
VRPAEMVRAKNRFMKGELQDAPGITIFSNFCFYLKKENKQYGFDVMQLDNVHRWN